MKKNDIKKLKDGVVIKLVHCRTESTITKAVVLKKWEFEHASIHHLLLYGDDNRIYEGIFSEIGGNTLVPETICIVAQLKKPMEQDYVPVEEHLVLIPDLWERMLTDEPELVFYTSD